MRYDTPIYFVKVKQGAYLANGNYAEEAPEEVLVYADVTDSSARTLQLVYGGIKEGSKTIRINNIHNSPFDFIRIGNTKYKVDAARKLRHIHTFIVSEVQ